MQDDILERGLDLMLYGMGTVIVFLTLLVIATILMSAGIRRFLPEPAKPTPAPAAPQGAADPKLQAIIKAAIEQHRARRR